MASGAARLSIDIEAYRERLQHKAGGAAYNIVRRVVRSAQKDPKRIAFPEASNPKVLRACELVLEEGIATPVLLGRRQEIEILAALVLARRTCPSLRALALSRRQSRL